MEAEVQAAFDAWKALNDEIQKDRTVNKPLWAAEERAANKLFDAAGFRQGVEFLHKAENTRYKVVYPSALGTICCQPYNKAGKLRKSTNGNPFTRNIYAREFNELQLAEAV